MASEHTEKFDLEAVQNHFSSALYEEDDVHLEYYLNSYEELNKFFNLMGTVFGFVSKDLKEKMETLMAYLKNDSDNNFHTVKKMIEYERDNHLLHKKGYVSGTRTLLRLHRGLDFIRVFLNKVGDLPNEEKTSSVCREAYDNTLSKFHPFIVRTGAHLAMYTLPTKGTLLKKVCGEEDVKKALEILPSTLNVTATVYDRIEALYNKYDLHGLP